MWIIRDYDNVCTFSNNGWVIPSAAASIIKDQVFYTLLMDDFDIYIDRTGMIAKEDVQRVVNKYLDTNNLFTSIAGPVEKNI